MVWWGFEIKTNHSWGNNKKTSVETHDLNQIDSAPSPLYQFFVYGLPSSKLEKSLKITNLHAQKKKKKKNLHTKLIDKSLEMEGKREANNKAGLSKEEVEHKKH